MKLKKLILTMAIVFFISGCVHQKNMNYATETGKIITVLYSLKPFRTFHIFGTNIQGIKIDQLKDELVKHQAANPGFAYEFVSDVKSTIETEIEIFNVFTSAGVILKHFWVSVNILVTTKPGKYGLGKVDILEDLKVMAKAKRKNI
jgi:hypothetical protein